MSIFDESQQRTKILLRLILSISLASAPLFLSLINAKTLSSTQAPSPSTAWTQPYTKLLSDSGQWNQQLVRQGLVAADSPIPNPKALSEQPQHPVVVAQKQLAKEKKTRKIKIPNRATLHCAKCGD